MFRHFWWQSNALKLPLDIPFEDGVQNADLYSDHNQPYPTESAEDHARSLELAHIKSVDNADSAPRSQESQERKRKRVKVAILVADEDSLVPSASISNWLRNYAAEIPSVRTFIMHADHGGLLAPGQTGGFAQHFPYTVLLRHDFLAE